MALISDLHEMIRTPYLLISQISYSYSSTRQGIGRTRPGEEELVLSLTKVPYLTYPALTTARTNLSFRPSTTRAYVP